MPPTLRSTAQITARAWRDPAFKARLMNEPAAVMREFGIDIPHGVTIRMHENTPTERHAVLAFPQTALKVSSLGNPERIVPMATFHTIFGPSLPLDMGGLPRVKKAAKKGKKKTAKAAKKGAKKAAKKAAKKGAKKAVKKAAKKGVKKAAKKKR